tara:strand:- start:44 stop:418 length:375 start_codon:yes stop_codon:yes gene_type:complete
MSTLKVNTIQDASGNNSSTPQQILKGRGKIWWNYNQTSPNVRDSFNISSITDEGTGEYTANFSITVSNPCGFAAGSYDGGGHNDGYADTHSIYVASTTAEIRAVNYSGARYDCQFNYGIIFTGA